MDTDSTATKRAAKADWESGGHPAGQREEAYSFLASVFFAPPSAEMMQLLADGKFKAIFGSEAEQAANKMSALVSNDDSGSDSLETILSDTRQEFMQLFKVPGAQYVTPYESVFLSSCEVGGKKVKGLLMGQSAIDVKQWYRLAALDISDDYADMPDHIALELSYLAHLCAREQEYADAGNEQKLARALEMERDFLAAHIVSWIDMLRDKIIAKTGHPFYQSIAALAAGFTRRDMEALENLMGVSNGSSVPDYKEMESQPEDGD